MRLFTGWYEEVTRDMTAKLHDRGNVNIYGNLGMWSSNGRDLLGDHCLVENRDERFYTPSKWETLIVDKVLEARVKHENRT